MRSSFIPSAALRELHWKNFGCRRDLRDDGNWLVYPEELLVCSGLILVNLAHTN
jgi:hypothetical protein